MNQPEEETRDGNDMLDLILAYTSNPTDELPLRQEIAYHVPEFLDRARRFFACFCAMYK